MNQDSGEGQIQKNERAEISSSPEYSAPGIGETMPEVEPSIKRRSLSSLKASLQKFWAVLALVTYIVGLGSGYVLWGRQAPADASKPDQANHADMQAMAAQINPQGGYELPATFGDIGPRLLAAGAIDLDAFVKIYQEIGRPLTKEQLAILTDGSNAPVVIDQKNQHFLLNLFWALGLANQNRVLTEGPMMRNGKDGVVNFASTGGWTIAAKPVKDLYAGTAIITLTEEQQKRLEEVAQGVYRPCCDNPTHFPDCNHGMAMLGLLELLASQGASTDEMYKTAKYVNASWFPQQTLEVAVALKVMKNKDFDRQDGRQVVGRLMSSSSGFQSIHQWLVQNGQLVPAPKGGGSCGVR